MVQSLIVIINHDVVGFPYRVRQLNQRVNLLNCFGIQKSKPVTFQRLLHLVEQKVFDFLLGLKDSSHAKNEIESNPYKSKEYTCYYVVAKFNGINNSRIVKEQESDKDCSAGNQYS